MWELAADPDPQLWTSLPRAFPHGMHVFPARCLSVADGGSLPALANVSEGPRVTKVVDFIGAYGDTMHSC